MVLSPIPEDVDTLLTRDQVAEALTDAGFPVRPKTLATKATRGGGRPFGVSVRSPSTDGVTLSRGRSPASVRPAVVRSNPMRKCSCDGTSDAG